MKKIISILFIIIYSITTNSNAKSYRVGDVIEDKFFLYKNKSIELPEGNWELYRSHFESVIGFPLKMWSFAQVENNELMGLFSFGRFKLAGEQQGIINNIIKVAIFNDPYDGCYERPEYFIVESYVKGSTHNCLVVRHYNTKKELYTPDDKAWNGLAKLKYWLKQNSIDIPTVMLGSTHYYFSRSSRGDWFIVEFAINPNKIKKIKLNYLSEEASEFHKFNIDNFEDHKKVMGNWVSISSKNHKQLEKIFDAKEHQLLDLDKYISSTNNLQSENQDLIEELSSLNKMFQEGLLTREEFEKAKKKLLN